MRRDIWMIAALAALCGFGVVLQMRLAGGLPAEGMMHALAGGLALAVGAAFLGAHPALERLLASWGRWACWAVAAGLLAALLVCGRRYRGGLYLPGLVNPSEGVKLALVLFCAGSLAHHRAQGGRAVFGGVGSAAAFFGALGAVAALAAAAGDLGLVAQLALTAALMLFAASWAWGLTAAGVLAAGVCAVGHAPTGHLATRLAIWRDPFADPMVSGWQTLQGLTAVLSGGWGGSGFGLGEVHNVPIATSDFVYAALAEEIGFAGCAAVLGLWAFVLVRGLLAAWRRAEEAPASALAAAGLVASLAVQIILNVAGVLNLLPMTGITLPLLSHGGSSLAVTLVMCGLLVGISARPSVYRSTPISHHTP